MSEPLENLYFNWLCAKVVDLTKTSPSLTYWTLFKILHTTEFVWVVPHDSNRIEDGKDLRRDFLIEADIPDDPNWRESEGCSVFEMLIAFSRRASFASGYTDMTSAKWFWEVMDNLKLKEHNDANADPIEIDHILEVFIWRLYDTDGTGGMFPIRNPRFDQTKLEIWDQFSDYLIDKE